MQSKCNKNTDCPETVIQAKILENTRNTFIFIEVLGVGFEKGKEFIDLVVFLSFNKKYE